MLLSSVEVIRATPSVLIKFSAFKLFEIKMQTIRTMHRKYLILLTTIFRYYFLLQQAATIGFNQSINMCLAYSQLNLIGITTSWLNFDSASSNHGSPQRGA